MNNILHQIEKNNQILIPIVIIALGLFFPILIGIYNIIKGIFKGIVFIFKLLFKYKTKVIKSTSNKKTASKDIPKPVNIECQPICLNDKNKGIKQLDSLKVLINKISNDEKKTSMKSDFAKMQARVMGDKVILDAIARLEKPVKYAYDVTINYMGDQYHYDNIVLSNEGIYLIDSTSIQESICVDKENNFFTVSSDGSKEYMKNPIKEQTHKAGILNQFLIGLGIKNDIPIYTAVTLVSGNAKLIDTDDKIEGLYTDYIKFLKNIKCNEIANKQVNKIGYYLTEFSETTNDDLLDKYDIKTEDFVIR